MHTNIHREWNETTRLYRITRPLEALCIKMYTCMHNYNFGEMHENHS